MSVASNTFKRGIKVRTKSGKPEQVLALASGAKVSVNDKELQTLTSNALNERTVGHIQKALGIPGKRNNLKGQGTKNILSFDTGAGGDDSSPDDDADNASEAPEGGMDMGGSDSADSSIAGNGSVSPFSGTDPDGFGAGSTPTPTGLGQDDPADTSYSSISGAKSGLTGSNIGAIQSAINEQEEVEDDITARMARPSWTKTELSDRDKELSRSAEEFEGYTREGFDVGLGSTLMGLASLPVGGLLGTGISLAGKGFDIATGGKYNLSSSELVANPTARSRAAAGTPTGVGGMGLGGEEVDAPVASPEGESGPDYKDPARSPRTVRAASNNVDLATPLTETDYTRNQLRRARRNITRYA
jgi:hypothetical protein